MNKFLLSAVGLVLLSACSAPAVKDTLLIQQSAQEQAKNLGLSPQEVLDETRDLQILAQREDLYFYSPTYIAQGEDEISSAESAFTDKLPDQKIIAHALTGQQMLKRGLENKKTVLEQLKLSLDGLALLSKMKVEALFPGDYSDVQDDTKDLIILIEQGNTSQALKDQNSVLIDIANVEIKILKKTYLGQAELALEKAEDSDAEDFAAASYEKASIAVDKLGEFIQNNRKQLKAIEKETLNAVHLGQHAQHVSIAVEPLLKLKPDTAEQHVLSIEKLMARIGTSLKQDDVSYLSLDKQSIALAQAAETISKQAQSTKKQGHWEIEKAELQKKLAQLQAKLDNQKKVDNTDIQPQPENEINPVTPAADTVKALQPETTQAELTSNPNIVSTDTPVTEKSNPEQTELSNTDKEVISNTKESQ